MLHGPPNPEAPRYHIVTYCRLYDGHGYRGASCFLAGIPYGKTYDCLLEACAHAGRLQAVNPVGWRVVTVPEGREVWAGGVEGEETDG